MRTPCTVFSGAFEAMSERQPGAARNCPISFAFQALANEAAWIDAIASRSVVSAGRMAMVEVATLISASPSPWTLAASRQAGGGRAAARSAEFRSLQAQARRARPRSAANRDAWLAHGVHAGARLQQDAPHRFP